MEFMERQKDFYLRLYMDHGVPKETLLIAEDARKRMPLELILMISDNWIRYVELEQVKASSIDKKIDHYIDLCINLLLSDY